MIQKKVAKACAMAALAMTGIAWMSVHATAQQPSVAPSIEEQRRFAQFQQQYDLVQAMKSRAAWEAGVPQAGPPGTFIPGVDYGGAWPQVYPAPFLRRGIWSYGFYDGARQSIGQHHVQTAPDRWESYPVYPEVTQPAYIDQPLPTVAPQQEIIPPQPSVLEPQPRGVRGF